MPLEDGKYLIVSVHRDTGHLELAPYAIPILPPTWFIVGSLRKDLNEVWKVTRTDHGTYTVHSASHTRAAWRLRGRDIVANEELIVKPEEFSIEHAGEDIFTIRVPNQDLVATLEAAGVEQLHVEGQVGKESQLWRFVRLEDD